MRSKRELVALAEKHGVPTKKTLKAWPSDGGLVTLEVDRPSAEILDELREAGLLT